MQRLCHKRSRSVLLATSLLCTFVTPVLGDPPVHDYPTQARVEFVNECIATSGDTLSSLYQCSCAIDRIAERLSYDEFVESSTFARYSNLPGEGGALFRDSEQARKMGKLYREVEAQAFMACGVKKK
ncbi:hypothetical protein [Povalibacter sp.]|uniref:hypothetical protein n=1 Tax=Povalibacter sp. TaxID=1962978 RepID=UPI0032C237AD